MPYFDISVLCRPCGRACLLLALAVSSLSSADRSFLPESRRPVLLPRRPLGLLSLRGGRGGRGLLGEVAPPVRTCDVMGAACFGAREDEDIPQLTAEVADAPVKGHL